MAKQFFASGMFKPKMFASGLWAGIGTTPVVRPAPTKLFKLNFTQTQLLLANFTFTVTSMDNFTGTMLSEEDWIGDVEP